MLFDYDPYYRARQTEEDFCRDFHGDEILIDGLHAMQCHFWNHNVPIEIPVVRLMNTVHYLAAYMFSNDCSGDQLEYDILASESLGRERKLIPLVMIVLAAMLKRTEGFRAVHCRDLILSDRSTDFEEGVTLYDRFLRSAEKRFSEEDFLLNTHQQILRQQEEITRLTSENIQLKYTITTMEEKYQQINIGSQTNIGTQNNYHITYAGTPTDIPSYKAEPTPEPQIELFRFIHPSVTDTAERLKIHREVENLVRTLPLPDICRYLMEMRKNSRVYLSVKPEIMFEELHRMGMPDETNPGFSIKNFRSYFNVND